MKHTVLTIIATSGLLIPLLWITGTVTSIVYFCLQGREESIAADDEPNDDEKREGVWAAMENI